MLTDITVDEVIENIFDHSYNNPPSVFGRYSSEELFALRDLSFVGTIFGDWQGGKTPRGVARWISPEEVPDESMVCSWRKDSLDQTELQFFWWRTQNMREVRVFGWEEDSGLQQVAVQILADKDGDFVKNIKAQVVGQFENAGFVMKLEKEFLQRLKNL